jgi:iron complex transport system ATP-binding protein
MLSVDGICFSYRKHEVLKNISCSMNAGEVVSILGRNGSGKTTLLKTINGILKPQRGTVLVEGTPVFTMPSNEIAQTIGYVPQRSGGIRCTVFDAILLGRKPYIRWQVSSRDIEIVREIIEFMGLQEQILRDTSELSGGEFQKVLIARALAQEPKILLFDEPVNHLDIKNQIETLWHIREITNKLHIVTIIVIHDINLAMRFSDKYLLLKDGSVYAFGSREMMNEENIRAVFGIDVKITIIDKTPYVHPRINMFMCKKC